MDVQMRMSEQEETLKKKGLAYMQAPTAVSFRVRVRIRIRVSFRVRVRIRIRVRVRVRVRVNLYEGAPLLYPTGRAGASNGSQTASGERDEL